MTNTNRRKVAPRVGCNLPLDEGLCVPGCFRAGARERSSRPRDGALNFSVTAFARPCFADVEVGWSVDYRLHFWRVRRLIQVNPSKSKLFSIPWRGRARSPGAVKNGRTKAIFWGRRRSWPRVRRGEIMVCKWLMARGIKVNPSKSRRRVFAEEVERCVVGIYRGEAGHAGAVWREVDARVGDGAGDAAFPSRMLAFRSTCGLPSTSSE